MSLFSKKDYVKEHKKTRYPRAKIPTKSKTTYCYCRNCNARNTESDRICRQCEKPIMPPKMRRPYR